MSNIKPTKPPKNRIIEEFDKLIVLDILQEEKDNKIYEFYNRNFDFFERVDSITSNSMIASFINIKIIYIRILDDKEMYKDASYICKQLPGLLAKLDKEYYKYQEIKIRVLRWEGVILGRLKQYKKSNEKFKLLFNIGEEKNFYKRWLTSNYYCIYYKYVLAFLICTIILTILRYIPIYLDCNLPVFPLKLSSAISIISLILMIVYFSLENIITYFINKKYKIT
ncbi:hypothetical protein [Dysgonomonas sp. ZJ709]|uniref:hypothetical protein n=1 Tax=Dysgonomonas sp. ZJ709 TaxID=2709797 RepID=UPI0013ECB84E|nr:hypothetical protein [Dysgonomonas sp. ZJ709]